MNKQPTREVFRDRLREITDFAHRHAQNNLPPLGAHSSAEDRQAYFKKVWEGWKWAQIYITEDLVYIHLMRTALQELGKEARKKRDKSMANLLAASIKNLNHQEAILRLVANSMVWAMFGMQRWRVRWLWTARPPAPITSIGSQTSEFIDDINDNPDSVALMADITSLVGVGDVLVADWDHGMRPVIVELKSGATNSRIVSLVEAHQGDIEKVPPHELEEIGPHARKHFERVARQTEREQNFESIATNDTGKDPETGAYMQNIGTEAVDLDIYDPVLDAMMSDAAKAGSAIECIDGCLWMGVYYLASLSKTNLGRAFCKKLPTAVPLDLSVFGMSNKPACTRECNPYSCAPCPRNRSMIFCLATPWFWLISIGTRSFNRPVTRGSMPDGQPAGKGRELRKSTVAAWSKPSDGMDTHLCSR